MNIFVKPTDVFTLVFVVGEDPKNAMYLVAADNEDDARKAMPTATNFVKHSVVLRFPTYKDNAQAVDDSIDTSNGKFEFKTTMLRFHRLTRLLKQWSFQDEKNEPIAINPQTIGSLNPVIASYLGNKMEEILGLL